MVPTAGDQGSTSTSGASATWCLEGRLPPRLYHVMVAWVCPATTQFRSKVSPSTTEGDEDSILIGGETLGTGDRMGRTTPSQTRPMGLGTSVPRAQAPALHALTVGGAAALDGDDERGLPGTSPVTDVAYVLARVGGSHLRDPQPGAHDLEGAGDSGWGF